MTNTMSQRRSESKRAKLDSIDTELLRVMRFIFNDGDEKSKESCLVKWGETETAGKSFTLNNCVQIKENRICLTQNLSTFRDTQRT